MFLRFASFQKCPYVGYVAGNNEGSGTAPVNIDDDELLYIGASVATPIDGLNIGIAYDDRQFSDGDEADAVAVYAVYQLSDSVSIAGRYDSVDIDLVGNGGDNVDMATLTLGYSIWENVLTRLEFGWESGLGAVGKAGTDSVGRLTDGGGDSSYFALNCFYQF